MTGTIGTVPPGQIRRYTKLKAWPAPLSPRTLLERARVGLTHHLAERGERPLRRLALLLPAVGRERLVQVRLRPRQQGRVVEPRIALVLLPEQLPLRPGNTDLRAVRRAESENDFR